LRLAKSLSLHAALTRAQVRPSARRLLVPASFDGGQQGNWASPIGVLAIATERSSSALAQVLNTASNQPAGVTFGESLCRSVLLPRFRRSRLSPSARTSEPKVHGPRAAGLASPSNSVSDVCSQRQIQDHTRTTKHDGGIRAIGPLLRFSGDHRRGRRFVGLWERERLLACSGKKCLSDRCAISADPSSCATRSRHLLRP